MSKTSTSQVHTRERRDLYHEADVVVVGAGVFGCAAAFALANQGRSVLLLERWLHEPDRIVGELLQPGGLTALRKLGLGHCVENIDAIPCYGYNVIYHGEPCAIPYPSLNEKGEVTHAWGGRGTGGTKQEGCGFHHGKFIAQLRKACLGHKNITVVETEVVKTIRGEHTDQILGVETRTTVNKETGEKKSDYFFGQLTIPPSGLVILGDALNMRHPLTGGGMTVAFNDALLLAELLHPDRIPNLEDTAAIRDAMHKLYWRRKNFTSIINTLAQALYSLFAANDRQLRALQMGCFEYFRRGWTDGPAGLLGGIIQRPLVLAYHFFYVAFVAIWMNACNVIGGPLGFWKLPLALIDAVLILWKACIVFLPVIWREGFQ
ncbi:SE-domain-containing protein [Trichoderma longibrachiatum ATCC 18648]|uniref:Squalene monooxygenase n=1 Tax=Trichoderma longibrachiatum ATCC 18648 TaxID=983965 RepID=A0A2T4CES0_TRILO|nr:SE-domain-containing protein [Trichoderma longibrachiatum ATCC 18648]